MKLKLGFLWLCLNSQKSFPAPKSHAYNSTVNKHGVVCIIDTVDSRLFQTNRLPMIGKDVRLTIHIIKLPGVGQQHFHRSKVSAAGFLRNSSAEVYISNSQRKVGNIINNCFRVRRFGGSIQAIQTSHHRVTLQPPYSRLILDIIGPYVVKVTQTSLSRDLMPSAVRSNKP